MRGRYPQRIDASVWAHIKKGRAKAAVWIVLIGIIDGDARENFPELPDS